MTLVVNLAILAALFISAYTGTKRGMVLIGLELISFAAATLLALAVYHPAGSLVLSQLHVSSSLANLVGFVVVWGITEIICAATIRFTILPHLHRGLQLSGPNRIGGAVLNTFKTAAIITLGLIMLKTLPLPASVARPFTSAFISQQFLLSSGGLQSRLAPELGRDFSDSLNFFTVTSEPESEQRVELGYTTDKISVDADDENAMLKLLNQERTTRGLPPLTMNTKARSVARAYSTNMFARGFFSHVDLEGRTPFDRMKAGGVKFNSAGENLALAPTLQQAHDGLMKSPGHKANILSTSYHTVGIGVIDGGPYGLMVTQDFTD